MSVHTRTRRIRSTARPVKRVRHEQQREASIPWRNLFKSEYEKHSKAGYTLKSYRSKHALTQKELAKLVKVNQHHISEMENGKRQIGKEIAKRFATLFKIDYRVFL